MLYSEHILFVSCSMFILSLKTCHLKLFRWKTSRGELFSNVFSKSFSKSFAFKICSVNERVFIDNQQRTQKTLLKEQNWAEYKPEYTLHLLRNQLSPNSNKIRLTLPAVRGIAKDPGKFRARLRELRESTRRTNRKRIKDVIAVVETRHFNFVPTFSTYTLSSVRPSRGKIAGWKRGDSLFHSATSENSLRYEIITKSSYTELCATVAKKAFINCSAGSLLIMVNESSNNRPKLNETGDINWKSMPLAPSLPSFRQLSPLHDYQFMCETLGNFATNDTLWSVASVRDWIFHSRQSISQLMTIEKRRRQSKIQLAKQLSCHVCREFLAYNYVSVM